MEWGAFASVMGRTWELYAGDEYCCRRDLLLAPEKRPARHMLVAAVEVGLVLGRCFLRLYQLRRDGEVWS